MLVAGVTSLFMTSITEAWKFLIALNAGIGLVQILRWYWWRINAWSEISAMVASLIVSIIVFVHPATKDIFAFQMLIIVPISTVVWIVVTFLTEPVSTETLTNFYNRVRPSRSGWKHIAAEAKEVQDETNRQNPQIDSKTPALFNWVIGVIFIYSFLFSIGKLLLGFIGTGLIFLLIAIISGAIMSQNLPRKERNNI